MVVTIQSSLVQQIMPRFVIQRSLYEVRERPSKAYSWIAFVFANIMVEIPFQIGVAILGWVCWYWAVFGAHQSSETRVLMLLFFIEFQIFTSTFAHMVIAALPDAETAGNIATLLFSMMLTFNGVLQPPSALPGFWIVSTPLPSSSSTRPHLTQFTPVHVPRQPNDLPDLRLGRHRPRLPPGALLRSRTRHLHSTPW